MLRQFFRFNVERTRCVGFLHRNINAADPGVVHADVGYDVSTLVSNGNVHRLANFLGFLLRCGDHASSIFKCHTSVPPSPNESSRSRIWPDCTLSCPPASTDVDTCPSC